MRCPNCNTENPENARFCLNCGTPLSVKAEQPDSKAQAIPERLASKLSAERAAQSMKGERRIVTILFSDVHSSTALAENLDPEEWTEIMNDAFDHLIAPVYRYEGTLARLMGDAVLAFFGAPIAHEDDPERAVLAGLEIIDGIREFRAEVERQYGLDFNVRVGINTGLVVVGDIGSDLKVEYTAMGDAVNLAARMEQTALPGTVQISGDTYRLVGPLFDVESLGDIVLKGRAGSTPAYRVLRRRPRAVSARGIEGLNSPLIGRDAELGSLQSAFDNLLSGSGQIVTVVGEAGLGKSRLVREFKQAVGANQAEGEAVAAAHKRPLWLEGSAHSYQLTTPYAAIKDLLAQFFAWDGQEPAEARYTRLRQELSTVMNGDADRVAPLLASLLDIGVTGEAAERINFLQPPQLRAQIFDAVKELMAAIAERRPLVLAFEDLHWADPSTLELLESLMSLTEESALMLLALLRPQQSESSWRFHELAEQTHAKRYTSILLQPLAAQDATALIANLLHIENLPEHVRSLILQKAEGNPFFVEELIRSLLDAGTVVRKDGRWQATREIDQIALPDTLAGVITARLDRLDDSVRQVGQTASVIGREWLYLALEDVHDEAHDLDGAVSQLEKRELVMLARAQPDRVYSFKHVLTQETAYRSLLRSRRRELHRRTAECLERLFPDRVNDIARHFVEAGHEARALPYMIESADRASRAYATQEALLWYRKALEVVNSDTDTALLRRAYEGLGSVLQLANDFAGALENYHAMLNVADEAGDVPMRVSGLNKLAFVSAFFLQQTEEAERYLDEAERMAREYGDELGMVELATIRCGTCVPVANFEGAVDYLGESIGIARRLENKPQLAMSLAHLALTLTYMTRLDEAQEVAEECSRISEEIGDLLHLAEVLSFSLPTCALAAGNMAAAERLANKAISLARRIGAALEGCTGQLTLATLAQARGDYGTALGLYRNVLQVAAVLGPMKDQFALPALAGLLSISRALGPSLYQQALEAHGATLDESEEFAGASVWAEMGFTALSSGQLDRAEQLFDNALSIPSAPWLLERPRLLAGKALCVLERGDIERSFVLLDEARVFAEARKLGHLLPFVALAYGKVKRAAGDLAGALQELEAAEESALSLQLRPLALEAQVQAAAVLRLLGDAVGCDRKRAAARSTGEEIGNMLTDTELSREWSDTVAGLFSAG